MIKKNGGIFGRNPTFNDVVVEGELTLKDAQVFDNDITINGDLTVNGTTTTINTVDLTVDDKNITMGDVSAKVGLVSTANITIGQFTVLIADTSGLIPGMTVTKTSGTGAFAAGAKIASVDSHTQLTLDLAHTASGSIIFDVGGATDFTADGGGITLKGATDKFINWVKAKAAWVFSDKIEAPGVTVTGLTASKPVFTDANQKLTSTGTLAIDQGGTGQTTQQAALNALAGATTSARFLRGDGTNVSMSAIQASDVPTLNQNTTGTAAGLSSTLVATSGGTGQSSYAVGDILYASTTSALSKLTDVATGNALISGGVGAAPSYGKIGLTTHISGTLPVANGGTNMTSYAVGDIVYASATGTLSALADVATGNALISGGVGAAPSYGKIGLTTHVSGTLPIANGGSGATTAQAGMNAFAGAVTSGQYLRGNGTNVVMSAIQAADVPTLNQNTTGTAAGLSATLAIASGGTNATSFTAKSGNVAGLVYFDGTKLANSATVTEVGFDTSTQTMSFKNAKTTGVNSLAAGTVSAPSLAADGDSNTGMYFPGADKVALAAGGVAKVYADSTGVGIATITPNSPLSMASSYKTDGSSGSSFDTIFPIASIMFKNADAANLATNTSNGNAELSLAIGTDIVLGAIGGVGLYGNADINRLTSVDLLKPTGYSVAARVIVVGDADQYGDAGNVYVACRSSLDNGNTWYDFDFGTGYRHQYWNARWLMAGKWMPMSTDVNFVHGGIVKFGVRAASSYGLLFTSISVQIAYIKL